jgi:hypothetical protein
MQPLHPITIVEHCDLLLAAINQNSMKPPVQEWHRIQSMFLEQTEYGLSARAFSVSAAIARAVFAIKEKHQIPVRATQRKAITIGSGMTNPSDMHTERCVRVRSHLIKWFMPHCRDHPAQISFVPPVGFGSEN